MLRPRSLNDCSKHYAGLEGEELSSYLKDFQAQGLDASLNKLQEGAVIRPQHFHLNILLQSAPTFLPDGGAANSANRIVAVDLLQHCIDLGEKLYKGPTKGI